MAGEQRAASALAPALSGPAAERVERRAAYDVAKADVSRWAGVVRRKLVFKTRPQPVVVKRA